MEIVKSVYIYSRRISKRAEWQFWLVPVNANGDFFILDYLWRFHLPRSASEFAKQLIDKEFDKEECIYIHEPKWHREEIIK